MIPKMLSGVRLEDLSSQLPVWARGRELDSHCTGKQVRVQRAQLAGPAHGFLIREITWLVSEKPADRANRAIPEVAREG